MIKKILALIISGNFKQLYYHLWIRIHNLDHCHINIVSEIDGKPYSNSGGPLLEKVIQTLAPPKDSVVLEYGVGKGLAAITLSKYFKSVIGVDISQELINIAQENIKKMKVNNIKLYCEDARTFDKGLDEINYVYMFHPFHYKVTEIAMQHLKESVKCKPRKLIVIYKAPYQHDTMISCGFSHRCDLHFKKSPAIGDRFAIYEIK